MSTDHPGTAPEHAGDASQQPTYLEAGASDVSARSGAHPVLVYSLMRFGVLLLTGGVLYLLGVRGVWLLLFAFLLSGIASIFVLNRRREEAAGGVVEVVHKVNRKIETSASAEDELVEKRTDATPADDDLDHLEPKQP